jgi:hypothetical protein
VFINAVPAASRQEFSGDNPDFGWVADAFIADAFIG